MILFMAGVITGSAIGLALMAFITVNDMDVKVEVATKEKFHRVYWRLDRQAFKISTKRGNVKAVELETVEHEMNKELEE